MADKTNLSVNSLDFATIKSNLKSYLSSQAEFKDFNFDGAGMSILLDVLAYNSHYSAYYNNMIANEMFLDSAVKRSSIVSIARHLGYTPTSMRGAESTVNVTLGTTAGFSSTLPIGTVLTGTKDGTSYNFINMSTATIDLNAATNHISSLVVKEGRLTSTSFIVNTNDTNQQFIIPDNNIDTTTLTVRVQESPTDDSGYSDNWELASDINDVTSTSKVYFLQEIADNKFEIYFGDDVVGAKIDDGNLITVSYLVVSGEIANNIGQTDSSTSRAFSYRSGDTVEVVSSSSGGAERETLLSIRNNAPKSYQAQDRAVTTEDFKSILARDYPDMESINVWGGEENDPPEYGRVIVAFKPISGTIVTEQTKESIVNSISRNKNIVSIDMRIEDPDYTYLNINTTVNYDSRLSTVSADSLKTLVKNTIINFGDETLEKFDKGLRYSKFIKEIDDTDTSILSNETSIVMEKRLYPNLNKNASYELKFGNKVFHPYEGYLTSLESSSFKYTDSNNIEKTVYLDEDGEGKLRIYHILEGVKTYLDNNAGSINYETGVVNITDVKINSLISDSYLKIKVSPRDNDINSIRNAILLIDSDDINITMSASASRN